MLYKALSFYSVEPLYKVLYVTYHFLLVEYSDFKIKQGALYKTLYKILYKTLCIKVRLGRKIRLNTTYIEGKKQILLLLLLGISITESLDRTLHVNMAWLSSDYCIQNRFNDLKRQLYFFY